MRRNPFSESRTNLLLFLALPLVFILMACSKGGDEKTPSPGQVQPAKHGAPDLKQFAKAADIEAGKQVYMRYCHFCHGVQGLGDGPVGIAITPHPADFVNDTKRMSKTDEELFISITEGVKKEIGGDAMHMPRWKEILTEQERYDVLMYIRRLSKEKK